MGHPAVPVLSELVTALEGDGQHARAVAVLKEHESSWQWPNRFQYVYNSIMAGCLEQAREGFGGLPEPEDAKWAPAREKVRRVLARADAARGVTPLSRQDLRGWHYVLTGGVLGTLSPYGFESMTGRWAYVSDSTASCATALQRLKLILGAADTAPQLRRLDDGSVGHGPADDRPAQDIAAEIAGAAPEQDEGDGETPADPDKNLRGFVAAVTAPAARERDGDWLGGC